MLSLKPEHTSRREISKNIRLTEFQYSWEFDGKYFCNESLNLVSQDYDFDIVWTIECQLSFLRPSCVNSCTMVKFKSSKCNGHVYGNFLIEKSKGNKMTNANRGTFDAYFFPFEQNVSLHCPIGEVVVITVQVYREDERSSIIETYANHLGAKNTSDVAFTFDTEVVPADKQVLSLHSTVFASMFELDMMERKTSRVEIVDIEPNIFRLLLRFIYCGQLDTHHTEDLLGLAVAADKYSVESLVKLCCYRLSFKVSVATVVDVLIVADQVRHEFLKRDCVGFVIKNKDEVTKTKSYEKMVRSHAHLLSEIFCQLKCA